MIKLNIDLKGLIEKIEEQNQRVNDYKTQRERCELVHKNKKEQVMQRAPKNKIRTLY